MTFLHIGRRIAIPLTGMVASVAAGPLITLPTRSSWISCSGGVLRRIRGPGTAVFGPLERAHDCGDDRPRISAREPSIWTTIPKPSRTRNHAQIENSVACSQSLQFPYLLDERMLSLGWVAGRPEPVPRSAPAEQRPAGLWPELGTRRRNTRQ
jgi:hypothetical protein